eukprot:5422533-Prymnesium_polylepis.1
MQGFSDGVNNWLIESVVHSDVALSARALDAQCSRLPSYVPIGDLPNDLVRLAQHDEQNRPLWPIVVGACSAAAD